MIEIRQNHLPKPRAATSVAMRITRDRFRNSKKTEKMKICSIDFTVIHHVKLDHVLVDVYLHE
jgi:hypothetical protein